MVDVNEHILIINILGIINNDLEGIILFIIIFELRFTFHITTENGHK